MVTVAEQFQTYDDIRYPVAALIAASKDFEVIELPVEFLYRGNGLTPDPSLHEFAIAMKRVMKSDLKFPIILSPINTVLDGKHRLTKAIYQGETSIKCVKFHSMPDIGYS